MVGRARPPPRHAVPDRRRHPYPPASNPRSRPPPPNHYEEDLHHNTFEIRRLSADNRRLADDRVSLQRELSLAREEIHRLGVGLGEVEAEREARVREMVEKGMRLEAELRAREPMRKEVGKLRGEIGKVEALRKEQVQGLTKEIERARAEVKQSAAVTAEVEGLRQELAQARSAYEYEKKGNEEILEQRQAMENNLVSMAHEIEKLKAELASRAGRTVGTTYDTRSYGMKLNNPEGAYPSSFADGYGFHLGVGDRNPVYGTGAATWGSYDKSHPSHR